MALSSSLPDNGLNAEPAPWNPFVDPWQILRRRWSIGLQGLLIGIWAGLVYYLAAPPVYESMAQILVTQKDPNLPAHGTDASGKFESAQFATQLTTHLQLVVSPRVIRSAVQENRLDLLPTCEWARDSKDPEGLHYIIDHLEALTGVEDAKETASSRVMQVKFKHASPEECGLILQAIVASYQRFVNEKFHDMGSEASRLLTQAQTELSRDLRAEEAGYLAFLEQAPLLWRGDGDKSTNSYLERIKALETALSEIRLRHTESKARLEVIEGARSESADSVHPEVDQLALLNEKEVARLTLLLAATKGDSNNEVFQSNQPNRAEAYRAKYDQFLTLKAKEQSLLVGYGAKHPSVLELRKSMEAISEFLEHNSPSNSDLARRPLQPHEMVATYVELLKHDVADLEKRERDLLERTSRESTSAKSLLIYELRGEALRQEVQRKRQLYEAVVDRLKNVNLINDFGGVSTDVVAPAEIGQEPKLYLPIVLVLGAVLGSFSGGALAWLVDARDRTLHAPADVRQHTGQLPILAHVPHFSHASEAADGLGESSLVVVEDPDSAAARSFRTLRTALAGVGDVAQLKVIEVASANSGDGKSTLVANLAAVVAQSGNRVLAVDADLRHPRLHTVLKPANPVGLSQVLVGDAICEAAIQSTCIPHLHLLSAGAAFQWRSGQLTTRECDALLESIRNQYDLVLIDTPSALLAADAYELSPRVDGVLLVIDPENTDGNQALKVTQDFRKAGATLLGVVVNAVHPRGTYEYRE